MFPAHAGMDRRETGKTYGDAACSPHTRGWTGSPERRKSSASSVPRTRGDGPDLPALTPPVHQVFPAHAGMDRQID